MRSRPSDKQEKFLRALIDIGIPDLIAHSDSLDASKTQSILDNIGGLDLETKSAVIKTLGTILVWTCLNGNTYDADILSNEIFDQALQASLYFIAF